MDKKNIIYDPTDIQIDSFEKININDMDLEEMSNPHAVKMLLYQHVLNLHQLKVTKNELSEKQIELDMLKEDRENLRIELAGLNQNVSVDMASIFISFLGGFAINLLTTNWSDGLGWVIFLLCIAILFIFKYPLISKSIHKNN
jgi:hypothetical protein